MAAFIAAQDYITHNPPRIRLREHRCAAGAQNELAAAKLAQMAHFFAFFFAEAPFSTNQNLAHTARTLREALAAKVEHGSLRKAVQQRIEALGERDLHAIAAPALLR